MIYNFPNLLYKAVINCLFFKFTVDGRARNSKLIDDARNGNTAVFDGFLKDFALMWHMQCLSVTLMQICSKCNCETRLCKKINYKYCCRKHMLQYA